MYNVRAIDIDMPTSYRAFEARVVVEKDAEILSVINLDGNIVINVMYADNSESLFTIFEFFRCNDKLPTTIGTERRFIDTVVCDNNIFHVFERIS